MRIGVLVVAALAGSMLAAGCGGSESASVISGEPIALEQLSHSAGASAEATSGRFAFSMEASLPGAEDALSFSGEGAFDRPSERASFSVDMSAFAQLLGGFFGALGGAGMKGAPDFDDPAAWQIDVVQDGKVSYVRFPALSERLPEGTSWIRSDGEKVKVDGFEFVELEDFASTDPRDFLKLLEAAGGEIDVVGVEELRGEQTTHYRVTLDPAKVAKTAAPGALGPLGEPLQAGVGEVPMDVWLDGDGLVRKLLVALSAEDQGQTRSGSVGFELWDFGEDVAIEPPPADEVVDASALRS